VATGRGRGGGKQQQRSGKSGEQRPVPPVRPGAPAARLGGHLRLPLHRVAMEAAPLTAAPANRRAGSAGEGGAEATGALLLAAAHRGAAGGS